MARPIIIASDEHEHARRFVQAQLLVEQKLIAGYVADVYGPSVYAAIRERARLMCEVCNPPWGSKKHTAIHTCMDTPGSVLRESKEDIFGFVVNMRVGIDAYETLLDRLLESRKVTKRGLMEWCLRHPDKLEMLEDAFELLVNWLDETYPGPSIFESEGFDEVG